MTRLCGLIRRGSFYFGDDAVPSLRHAAQVGRQFHLVRDAIRGLRGTVSLRSVEGQGTTFQVRLPVRSEALRREEGKS